MYPLINSIMFWVMVPICVASLLLLFMTLRVLVTQPDEHEDHNPHGNATPQHG